MVSNVRVGEGGVIDNCGRFSNIIVMSVAVTYTSLCHSVRKFQVTFIVKDSKQSDGHSNWSGGRTTRQKLGETTNKIPCLVQSLVDTVLH